MSQAPQPPDAIRRLQRLVWLLAGLVFVLLIGVGFSLPRSFAYEELLQENLALKSHLQEVDRKISEVDRILLRLRLYDAQLQSLGEARGGAGPLPPDVFANHRLLEGHHRFRESPVDPGLAGTPLDDNDAWIQGQDLRPAEAWAIAVEARAQTFLELVEDTEPDVNALVAELEDLRALEAALPGTWPNDGELTSGFGWRRHPMGRRYWRFHSGIDISNRRGTPITAASAGRVVRAAFTGGYGNYIEIDHGFGVMTTYGHMSQLHVVKGDEVQAGDLIGAVGSTGRSTGPHLHFEVRLDGHPVDPLDYLPR